MADLFGHSEPIKALSLWQPWASLVAVGAKIDETRHWSTPYRGPIAIHAAKTLDLAGAPDLLCEAALGPYWQKDLPRGCVVAVARLADCAPAERVASYLTPANLAAGNFSRGRFAWRLTDIRPLIQTIPVVGRQGLFNWTPPGDLAANLGYPRDHGFVCRDIGWAA